MAEPAAAFGSEKIGMCVFVVDMFVRCVLFLDVYVAYYCAYEWGWCICAVPCETVRAPNRPLRIRSAYPREVMSVVCDQVYTCYVCLCMCGRVGLWRYRRPFVRRTGRGGLLARDRGGKRITASACCTPLQATPGAPFQLARQEMVKILV